MKPLKRIAIILARMGSSRLPQKSIAEVSGRPIIAHLIERLKYVSLIDAVVLATPNLPEDEKLQAAGQNAGALVYAGSNEDVLDRLYQAACKYEADIVVHIGGDCPFVDPNIVNQAMKLLEDTGVDYVSNLLPMTYPGGLDVDVITFSALEKAWTQAKLKTTRRHPLAYVAQNPSEFRIKNFEHSPNLGQLRWTLDYAEDLEFVRAVYEKLYSEKRCFVMNDILDLVQKHPHIGHINEHLSQFSVGQPAYWDSEGYMEDLRSDAFTVLQHAISADKDGLQDIAAKSYNTALKIIAELHERSDALSRRK